MNRCFTCFKEYGEEFDICPYCGEILDTEPNEPIHLIPGTILAKRYMIGKSVGAGGFGIIYRAWDIQLETIVAVKEFFSSRLVTRAAGETEVIINAKNRDEFRYRKSRFLSEARTMAKFSNHRSIPNVFEFFEENNTAYIVMELLSGVPLNQFLRDSKEKINREFALYITNEVGQALMSLHKQGIIHRDVAPDNIFICDGPEKKIKLLDLGAAKLADSTDDVIDIIVKPGYSPIEQYDKTKNVGTRADIYALGATLYIMLTGIKPQESTDRKKNDTMRPPHGIDTSIHENLGFAVMKAMAVDWQFRFKNVEDFLKAINGEKKVESLAKEKKRRKRRRTTGVLASCIILAIIAFGVFSVYSSKKEEEVLGSATISVWFSVAEGSNEEAAMESVKEDFESKFKTITIELRAIPESEYNAEIEKAAENDELPTLFESTGISEDVLKEARSVKNVLNSQQADSCLFLDQYSDYYESKKQVPLGIIVPTAYVITNGNTSIDYSKVYFSDVSDFGDTAIAVDNDYKELIDKNITVSPSGEKQGFLDNEANSCAVLLSSSMIINDVREELTNYQKKFVYYSADKINCDFTYEWSIGEGNGDEIKAAERLLSWMLGNVYQNTLMISSCSDGQIPINETCFNEKIRQNNYASLGDIYKNFVFKR